MINNDISKPKYYVAVNTRLIHYSSSTYLRIWFTLELNEELQMIPFLALFSYQYFTHNKTLVSVFKLAKHIITLVKFHCTL